MSKKKIFIGMPLYEGNISHVTMNGIIDLVQWFISKNIEYKFYFISKDSLVSRARNTIVTKFLDDEEFGGTHLFFLDADIGFNHKNFERLLDFNKDLVCGVYPTKGINWERLKTLDNKNVKPQNLMNYNVNFIDPSNIKLENGFAEVKEGATGFMLIKKEVFLKLKENYLDLKFTPRSRSILSGSNNCYDFFKVGNYKDKKGNVNYLSEDFYFSTLWRDIGGKIFADLTSELSHLGKFRFYGSPSFNLKKN